MSTMKIDILTDKQKRFFHLRFNENGIAIRTLTQVGKKLGITKQGAHQLQKSALRRMGYTIATMISGNNDKN